MLSGLFVTGTDTGVGKTVVTAAVAAALLHRGHNVGLAKPVQSGAGADDPAGDGAVLVRLSGSEQAPGDVVGVGLAAPLAPLVAAEREGIVLDVTALSEHVSRVGSRHDVVLVEGAGGLFVPLTPELSIADLARELGLPILVVARATLGTVNHTALTVYAARSLGLTVAGVVLCGEADAATADNARLLEGIAHVPVVGHLPWLDPLPSPMELGRCAEGRLDLDTLLQFALHPEEASRA